MVWFFSSTNATLKAARECDVAQIKRLQKQNKLRVDATDPKRGHKSPLHFAVLSNNKEIVKSILKSKHVRLSIQDDFGNSPLHLACEQGSAEIAVMLLNKQMRLVQDPQQQLRLVNHLQRTALHICAYEGFSEIAYELISKSVEAQLEVTDRDGCTALHLACARGHKSVAEVLLQAGANPDALDAHKQTPLTTAKTHGFLSAVEEAFEIAASVEPCSPSTAETMDNWGKDVPERSTLDAVRSMLIITLISGLLACVGESFFRRQSLSDAFFAADIVAAFKRAMSWGGSAGFSDKPSSNFKALLSVAVSFMDTVQRSSDILKIAGRLVFTSITGLVVIRLALKVSSQRKKDEVVREGGQPTPGLYSPRTPNRKQLNRKRSLTNSIQELIESPAPAPTRLDFTEYNDASTDGAVFTRAHARRGSLDDTGVWAEPEASSFVLRGKTYISDGIKVQSAPAVFSAADMCVMEPGLKHATTKLPELVEFLSTGRGKDDQWLFVAWHVPVQPMASVFYAFKRTLPLGTDPVFEKLWERFRTDTDDFRNSRFKFIPSVKQVRATHFSDSRYGENRIGANASRKSILFFETLICRHRGPKQLNGHIMPWGGCGLC